MSVTGINISLTLRQAKGSELTYEELDGNQSALKAAIEAHSHNEFSAYTDEQAQDAAASMLTGGSHSGISFAYDDAAGTVNATVTGGAGHVIQDEGTPLAGRAALNFVGDGVTVTDDAAGGATKVTIAGGTDIPQQSTAPANPDAGQLWIDTGVSFAHSSMLVAEQIVTGSPVTSVSFTGLDLNAHGGYVIVCDVTNASASENQIQLFVNSNTTPTDYHSQCIFSNGATVSSNLYNTARIFGLVGSTGSSYTVSLSLVNSKMTASSFGNYGVGATIYISNFQLCKNTSDSNITNFSFVGNQTNGIAVGSVFRVYKRK